MENMERKRSEKEAKNAGLKDGNCGRKMPPSHRFHRDAKHPVNQQRRQKLQRHWTRPISGWLGAQISIVFTEDLSVGSDLSGADLSTGGKCDGWAES